MSDKPPDLGNLGDTLRHLLSVGQKAQPFIDAADLVAQRKRAGLCIKCGLEDIVRPGAVLGAACERATAHAGVDAILDGGIGKVAALLNGLRKRDP